MKIITIVEVVIMEAVGMVTNLHTGDVIETPNPGHTTVDTPSPNTAVGTDKDTRFNMVEVMGPDT